MNSLGRRLAASSARPSHITPRWAHSSIIRNIHSRRPLPYAVEDGLGVFLPPDALRTIAVDWQEGLLDRLNAEVKSQTASLLLCMPSGFLKLVLDTRYQNLSVVQTVIETAPDRSQTLAFSYASQALNNSFFLDHLVRCQYALLCHLNTKPIHVCLAETTTSTRCRPRATCW